MALRTRRDGHRAHECRVERLLAAILPLPFVETVSENEAAALPEGGLGGHDLRASIDHAGADGGTFLPAWDEAPAKETSQSLGAVRWFQDSQNFLRGRDVVSRSPGRG